MKTRSAKWFLCFLAVIGIFVIGLYGCGGEKVEVVSDGRDGGGVVPPPPPDPIPASPRHEAKFVFNTMEVKLAMEGNQVIHLVQNGVVSTLNTTSDNVASVVWFGSEPESWGGISAAYTLPITLVPGLLDRDTGYIALLTVSGKLYFLNIDYVDVSGIRVTATIDYVTELITYARQ